MQAVILCAGKSTRTYPLTVNKPKPLLKVMNKTLIEHNLEQLTGLVDEVIIVVGFKKEMLIERVGNKFKINYVIQKELNGPGGAIQLCKDFLKDKFIVLNGDDLYSRKDIEKCLKHKYCVMCKEVENPEIWGIFEIKNKKVVSFEEKPAKPKSNKGNIGIYVFDKKIFEHKLKKTSREEYEITDYITYLIKKGEDVYCENVSDYWLPIGYPWHLLEANSFFLNKIRKSDIKGTIEKNVTIKGPVIIKKNTIIKSGTYIEGPAYIGESCVIGPNAYIRHGTTIENNCNIRAEVYDSIIMENTTAKHFSYIGHSVIGENVNIAAGTITSDYRHDAKNNITLIKGKKIDSGRRKLGAFIGDNVRTGIGTLIYPGRKIWPGKTTLPGDIVKKDIE
ncbi:MAG: bifunctional sugar-1-phosphate nucleotidylyltransferase/acetyltransferase [bacterium]